VNYAKLGTTAALFSALTAIAQAPPAAPGPKIIFIGDYLTQDWSWTQLGWINEGAPGIGVLSTGGSSSEILARFQSDVVSQHPAMVHIMMGAVDAQIADDATAPLTVNNVMSNLAAMVKEAQAAKIPVILATEPTNIENTQVTTQTLLAQINAGVQAFGVANSIVVLNYADALCECVNSIAPPYSTVNMTEDTQYPDGLIPSAVGYTGFMAPLAEETITIYGQTIKYGWLSDQQTFTPGVAGGGPVTPNVNTVTSGAVLQFTPIATYSSGQEEPLTNTNFAGQSGTWTSSNPEVMTINQTGQAWAISNGTSIIKYTAPNGVQFSEWIMYVK
jgi:Bacterial Ig-like domain (group 2)